MLGLFIYLFIFYYFILIAIDTLHCIEIHSSFWLVAIAAYFKAANKLILIIKKKKKKNIT